MTTPAFYEIRIRGHLGSNWVDWSDGLRVLAKVHNLNLALISVNRVPARTAGEKEAPR
ncbi:MAG TPA: hypothetical protein VGK74_07415 [Symbiobacteriaceae bacterium]